MWSAIITAAITLITLGVNEWQESSVGNEACGGRPMYISKSWRTWQECTTKLQTDEIERLQNKIRENEKRKNEQKKRQNIVIFGSIATVLILLIFKKWQRK